jgi:hypothetical protein
MAIRDKYKLLFLLLILTNLIFAVNEEENKELKNENLQSPFFYMMTPKTVEINSSFTPNYSNKFEHNNQLFEYDYKNVFNNSLNINLPFFRDVYGWTLNTRSSISSTRVEIQDELNSHNDNYHSLNIGLGLIKRFQIWDMQWAVSNNFTLLKETLFDNNEIYLSSSVSTSFLIGDNRAVLGAVVLWRSDMDFILPVLPIFNYSGWINKTSGLLFEIKLPEFKLGLKKVIDNKLIFGTGFRLTRTSYFIDGKYLDMLDSDTEYLYRKIDIPFYLRTEYQIFENIWLFGEVNHSFNIISNYYNTDTEETLDSERELNWGEISFQTGIFFRISSFPK